ncbi:MAG: ArsA-related P-loop ATPase [Solirubrobacteraceae bacterium]|nr:ArsA-related P-loop ATPase [Solirubrobacteraceae bacterium]
MTAAALWPVLRSADLLVVCGAGGVGKTTVSAALGLALAREGRRVLVLTVDPARRLAEALGHDLGPEPTLVQLPGEPEMSAAMLDPATSFARVVDELRVDEADRRRLRESRITRELTGGDAGMQELMAIVELERFSSDDRYDVIVLDTPPALHALDLLDGPQRIVGLLSGRTVKAIGRASGIAGRFGKLPGPGRALGKLWGADLLTEIATFLDAAAPFGRALGEHLDHAEALLRSPQAAFTLVAAPADAPLRAAVELATELAHRDHPVAGTIVNRRRAPLDERVDAHALSTLATTLTAEGAARSAAIAGHVAHLISHEEALLDAAALPGPQLALAERPAQEKPGEVLSALATGLATG